MGIIAEPLLHGPLRHASGTCGHRLPPPSTSFAFRCRCPQRPKNVISRWQQHPRHGIFFTTVLVGMWSVGHRNVPAACGSANSMTRGERRQRAVHTHTHTYNAHTHTHIHKQTQTHSSRSSSRVLSFLANACNDVAFHISTQPSSLKAKLEHQEWRQEALLFYRPKS